MYWTSTDDKAQMRATATMKQRPSPYRAVPSTFFPSSAPRNDGIMLSRACVEGHRSVGRRYDGKDEDKRSSSCLVSRQRGQRAQQQQRCNGWLIFEEGSTARAASAARGSRSKIQNATSMSIDDVRAYDIRRFVIRNLCLYNQTPDTSFPKLIRD